MFFDEDGKLNTSPKPETMNNKKTAIVTGATGQAGSYLSELLLNKNYSVVGITRRTSGDNTSRLKPFCLANPNFELVEGDITDSFCIAGLIDKHKPDEIYNMAAQSHVGTSFGQPGLTWDITAKGVLNILEAIRHSGSSQSIKFVQASSSEMFGKNFDIKPTWNNEKEWLELAEGNRERKIQNEDTAFMPQSPYAVAKLAAHHLCRNYRDSYGIQASCAIMFNYESPRRGEQFVTRKITKWIGEFMSFKEGSIDHNIHFTDDDICIDTGPQAIDIKTFPKLRLGNLDAKRDWGYAEDTMKAVYLMAQKETPDDYVIATGETHSVREFLDVAFGLIGVDDWSNYVVVDPKFFRPAEVDYLLGDSSKAKEKLGWEPETKFNELVKIMVEADLDD
jgi:GDPmannose 4,6-dehydratase